MHEAISMPYIRPATEADLCRITEIEIFNYRLYFYPIFQNDDFYFDELQVPSRMEHFAAVIDQLQVYDDGVVKGFIQTDRQEVKKLFVEPVLHGQGIGGQLLEDAIQEENVRFLWALEKNTRAIAFYGRHGFHKTAERKLEEDTDEFLIRMEK